MKRKMTKADEVSQITEKVLVKMAQDLMKDTPPLPKLAVTDDVVVGLRFIIYKEGTISIHVSYTVDGDTDRRPFIKVGYLASSPSKAAREPKTDEPLTLEEARNLARAIKQIGDRGIDIERDSRRRLLSEIRRDGGKWSPSPNAPARKG